MREFKKGDAREISAVDPQTGVKYRFTLPHSTENRAEIRALRGARAEEAEAKPKPKPPKESDG